MHCFTFHAPRHSDPKVSSSILPNILDMVGNTPLVRLDKIAKREGLECELRTLNKLDTGGIHVIKYMHIDTILHVYMRMIIIITFWP